LLTTPDSRPEIQIGGQAVIEGVVMRGPRRWALAVRRPCGELYISISPSRTLAQRYSRWNKFPLRGVFALVDSLAIGIRSLTISAAVSLEEEEDGVEPGEEAGSCKDAGEEHIHKPMSTTQVIVAMTFALALFLGLFIVLPAVAAGALDPYISNIFVYNLIEGLIRVAVFVGYLALMSLLPDIRRVFQYHGAEHKVVHTYEDGLPLTPESARGFSTAHMRCGTAFIMVVLVLSILVFSLLGRPALWLRVLERLAIIPLVAAFSYEIIRFAGRYEDSRAMKVLMAPGLLLQKLTTREPDDDQLEVAIAALEAAMEAQQPA
jgi:uncharacterized protein YqhQ